MAVVTAVIMSAVMIFFSAVVTIFMMVTICFVRETELVVEKELNCCICVSLNSCSNLDACLCECNLSASSDSSADQNINSASEKKLCQCFVSVTVGPVYFCFYDLIVLYVEAGKNMAVHELIDDEELLDAMKEAKEISADPNVKSYSTMEELKAALE